MIPVDVAVPLGAKILFNNLHRTKDPRYLTQDLLAIRLPAGRVLDVSWYPERDPSGAYTVTVFCGSWDQQEHEVETRSIDEVVSTVQSLSEDYCQPVVLIPAATTTNVDEPPGTFPLFRSLCAG
jgi:hypothetical protein